MTDRPLVHALPPSPMQRLRQKRKAEGWKQYEGWLSPEALAILEREQSPHEPLNDAINRVLISCGRGNVWMPCWCRGWRP